MFASLRNKLGLVQVTTTPKFIRVEGINTRLLLADIYTVWNSSVIQKYMFKYVKPNEIILNHFFGLDFLYICQSLYDNKATRSSRRSLKRVIDALKENTWLGQVDRQAESITDVKKTEHQVPFPLKDYQGGFVEHFGKMVPAYKLKGYMLDAGAGSGKAQPLNAQILTPTGWQSMGSMKVGAEVIAADGSTAKVSGVFPQGVKDIYRITFKDGRSTEACADHLWEVHYHDRLHKDEHAIMSTSDMMERMNSGIKNHRMRIPLITPAEGVDKELPLDPWLLGVLIGDGGFSTKSTNLSSPDSEIITRVGEVLPEGTIIHRTQGNAEIDYSIVGVERGYNEVRSTLMKLKLAGCRAWEKEIPRIYMEGSMNQRLELIRGLMDTDGYIDEQSTCNYTTTSPVLADQFAELIRSVGGIAKISTKTPSFTYKGEKKEGRLAFTINIRHSKPSELFWLPRKKERAKDDGQYCGNLMLGVVSIVKTREAEAQCIMIDHPSHLYVTDSYIVTHNTVTDLLVGISMIQRPDAVIVISPKNAVERVWEATIRDVMIEKKPYWHSLMSRQPGDKDYYYVAHYESLPTILNYIKTRRDLKNVFVILDESHNFNRLASDRTNQFIELVQLECVKYNLWASGTPIAALGSECIPFLICVDPLFTLECQEAFRKIYGKDAKRANDILRNRIGHLKYYVPAPQDKDVEVESVSYNIRIPNGSEFTLANTREMMQKYILERKAFYDKNIDQFHNDYKDCISYYEKGIDTSSKEYLEYKRCFKILAGRFDPYTMKYESSYCNTYEAKTIIPNLPNNLKPIFRKAKGVVKYTELVIMGEALGNIVGKQRSRCNQAMLAHIDFEQIINNSKKKVMFYTSSVDVLIDGADRCDALGFNSLRVYGDTNKNLSKIIENFYQVEELNPLWATFLSLSTAVPVTIANTIVFVNQPFRDLVRTQTIARAARLGQDEKVFVIDILLDTGDLPNLSTRSNDIMEWSAEQVASILHVKNINIDTMSFESSCVAEELEPHWPEDVISMESNTHEPKPLLKLPPYLYHGSAYKQDELMPGFNRSGKLTEWDGTENNTWLYTSDSKDAAVLLGIASAIEKKFLLDGYHTDEKKKQITIEMSKDAEPISPQDIYDLDVYIYTLRADGDDGWHLNANPQNNIKGEYKTQLTVEGNILRTEKLDVKKALSMYKVVIK